MSVHYDPFDYAIHEDPYPVYRALRAHAPLYRNEAQGFWAVSRYKDVLAGFKDTARLSSRSGVSLEISDLGEDAERVLSILGMDPPRHGKMRALVSKGFTPRRVAALEPAVRALARAFIQEFAPAGRCEFVADFAGRLPMDVVSEMLGVPQADRAELRALADTVLHRPEGVRGVPPEGVAASARLLEYFGHTLAARRKRPGEDLASALLHAEVDGARLADHEIIAFCYLMVIAGNETTTKLLANCLYWLGRNPRERAKVRGRPERIPDWIEETLRYDTSTQLMARTVARDFEWHDETLKAGDKVLLLIGSANRDERVFEDAARFDLDRDASEHLAFGRGAHFCLGASLARLEARVALEEFERRIPDWTVDERGTARVHNPNVRGFARLPVAFTPAR